MRRTEAGPWLLAVAGLLLVVWSLRPIGRVSVAPGCEQMARVDAVVVCDRDLVVVDACGERRHLRSGDALDGCTLGRMTPEELTVLRIPIDPNVDGEADLQSLPGIGPKLAERIVRGRPYASAEDLLEVKGIGPRTLARIKPRLVVVDPRP